MKQPWYIESFQEDYLKIYAHRTDEAAREEIDDLVRLLPMQPPAAVLDLCCGNGRHSRRLAELGYDVTGIDLSIVLLAEAEKRNKEQQIRYLQYDVREIPFVEEFDYVLNLFTSFGYFEEMEENNKIFSAIFQALKPNGQCVIDFLNPVVVEASLVPYSEREVGSLHIIEKRRIEDKKVIKEIEIREGLELREYEERVNLFPLSEMKLMMENAGLEVVQVYGDLKQSEYREESSPRMILIGKK